jgi:hypothetical protein
MAGHRSTESGQFSTEETGVEGRVVRQERGLGGITEEIDEFRQD